MENTPNLVQVKNTQQSTLQQPNTTIIEGGGLRPPNHQQCLDQNQVHIKEYHQYNDPQGFKRQIIRETIRNGCIVSKDYNFKESGEFMLKKIKEINKRDIDIDGDWQYISQYVGTYGSKWKNSMGNKELQEEYFIEFMDNDDDPILRMLKNTVKKIITTQLVMPGVLWPYLSMKNAKFIMENEVLNLKQKYGFDIGKGIELINSPKKYFSEVENRQKQEQTASNEVSSDQDICIAEITQENQLQEEEAYNEENSLFNNKIKESEDEQIMLGFFEDGHDYEPLLEEELQ